MYNVLLAYESKRTSLLTILQQSVYCTVNIVVCVRPSECEETACQVHRNVSKEVNLRRCRSGGCPCRRRAGGSGPCGPGASTSPCPSPSPCEATPCAQTSLRPRRRRPLSPAAEARRRSRARAARRRPSLRASGEPAPSSSSSSHSCWELVSDCSLSLRPANGGMQYAHVR